MIRSGQTKERGDRSKVVSSCAKLQECNIGAASVIHKGPFSSCIFAGGIALQFYVPGTFFWTRWRPNLICHRACEHQARIYYRLSPGLTAISRLQPLKHCCTALLYCSATLLHRCQPSSWSCIASPAPHWRSPSPSLALPQRHAACSVSTVRSRLAVHRRPLVRPRSSSAFFYKNKRLREWVSGFFISCRAFLMRSSSAS